MTPFPRPVSKKKIVFKKMWRSKRNSVRNTDNSIRNRVDYLNIRLVSKFDRCYQEMMKTFQFL